MCASIDEHFCCKCTIRGAAHPPFTAMYVEENRGVLPLGLIDVELLDIRLAVSDALWLSYPSTSRFTVGGEALANLGNVRLIDGLVVGGVEFDLVIIEENARPFRVWRRPKAALFRECRPCQGRGSRT